MSGEIAGANASISREEVQVPSGSRRRIKAGDEALFCGGKGEIAPCFEPNSGTAGVDCFGMHSGLPRSCSGRICKGERLRWTDDAAGRKEHTPGAKAPLLRAT